MSFVPYTNIGFTLAILTILYGIIRTYGHKDTFSMFLLLIGFVFLILVSYYFLWYARIVVSRDKVFLPKTNNEGVPLFPLFGKVAMNISSITTVIKYSDKRISIVSKGEGNVQLSYRFYGDQILDNFVEEVWRQNENIKIIDSHG